MIRVFPAFPFSRIGTPLVMTKFSRIGEFSVLFAFFPLHFEPLDCGSCSMLPLNPDSLKTRALL